MKLNLKRLEDQTHPKYPEVVAAVQAAFAARAQKTPHFHKQHYRWAGVATGTIFDKARGLDISGPDAETMVNRFLVDEMINQSKILRSGDPAEPGSPANHARERIIGIRDAVGKEPWARLVEAPLRASQRENASVRASLLDEWCGAGIPGKDLATFAIEAGAKPGLAGETTSVNWVARRGSEAPAPATVQNAPKVGVNPGPMPRQAPAVTEAMRM